MWRWLIHCPRASPWTTSMDWHEMDYFWKCCFKCVLSKRECPLTKFQSQRWHYLFVLENVLLNQPKKSHMLRAHVSKTKLAKFSDYKLLYVKYLHPNKTPLWAWKFTLEEIRLLALRSSFITFSNVLVVRTLPHKHWLCVMLLSCVPCSCRFVTFSDIFYLIVFYFFIFYFF